MGLLLEVVVYLKSINWQHKAARRPRNAETKFMETQNYPNMVLFCNLTMTDKLYFKVFQVLRAWTWAGMLFVSEWWFQF